MIDRISKWVDNRMGDLIAHNRFLYDHPETAFEEFESSAHLAAWAESEGFEVVRGKGQLKTAFVASRVVGAGGPCIGFIAEYDALKGLGHACGHNLISTMSFGAAGALADAAQEAGLDCEIRIVGAPAEENGGGKILMIQAGYFDGVDCAMMIHPGDRTMVEDFSFANQIFRYRFFGRSAHASAAPWEGSDAVQGMLQALNLINGLRGSMKDYSRIHPLIVSSGRSNNVIADYAEMELNIRSADGRYLTRLIEDVNRCVRHAAEAYGLDFATEMVSQRYEAVRNSPVLEVVMGRQFEKLGETVLKRPRDRGVGSTDMGNVTHHLPAIHAHLMLGPALKTHTEPFREATIGPEGERVISIGSKAMAMTALELLKDPGGFDTLKRKFLEQEEHGEI